MKMSGYNGSQLWDVAFTTKAMLESDLGLSFPETLNKSYQFIDNMQILSEHATHQEFFRHPMIGSWPFSTAEQGWPVADCTAKGLSATLAVHKTGIVKPILVTNASSKLWMLFFRTKIKMVAGQLMN